MTPWSKKRGVFAVLLAALSACNLITDEPAPTPTPPGGTITVALGAVGPLDPADANGNGLFVLKTACDTLVSLDYSTGEARPALASAWQMAPDAKSVRITLRNGVRFHDGTRMDAQAIAANLSRIARPVTQSVWASLLSPVVGFAEVQSAAATELSGVEVKANNVLEISLTGPNAEFPSILTHPGLTPISPAEFSKDPDLPVIPVCVGPYRVEAETLILTRDESYAVRNQGYLSPQTRADGIVILGLGTQDEAFEAYVRRDMHTVPVPATRALEVPEAERATRTSSEITQLAFDHAKPETSSPKFRQAVSLAIDRRAIIDAAYGDGRQAITRWLGDGLPLDSSCAEFGHQRTNDPEKARALFAESGAQPGMKIPLIFDTSMVSRLVAQSLRVQAKDAIGVEMEAQPLDPPAFEQSLRDRPQASAWIVTSAPEVPVPGMLLESLFSRGGKGNLFGFENDEFEALIAGGRAAVKDERRKELFTQAEEVICNQMPVIPLWTGVSQWAVRPGAVIFEGAERIDVFGHLLLRHARAARPSAE